MKTKATEHQLSRYYGSKPNSRENDEFAEKVHKLREPLSV